MRNIEIDQFSGFCFGVVNAIRKVEDKLQESDSFYCLGDIVHNTIEVERLRNKGLKTLTHEEMAQLRNTSVLFRAHGEPPSTYELAKQNHIEVVDATCPVVLNLQKRIKRIYEERKDEQIQLLIFGKSGHAEVNGLVGQT
ncbi:MAG: 4-hydroxy-3-methylbut-2-enyl diphosphate reductase, partial [Bacteroidales bacterium]|nr:4-hydroxy-3-methylbut-2-enyl diphosphate reductase [Bacteroidales bacterium]